jgi:prepilin-type N-terminal cleavage/methylation domain-containing protein
MKKGFTLIEFLVVIAILGLLITVTWTAINSDSESKKNKENESTSTINCEDYGYRMLKDASKECLTYYLNK